MIKTLLTTILLSFLMTGDPNILIWAPNNHALTYSDFKAKPPKQKTIEKAMSNVGVFYDYKIKNDSLIINIYAVFDKSKSWMKEKKFLEHEQGHFNVSEISARQFRKAITELDGKVRNESIEDVIKIINQRIETQEIENQKIFQASCESDSLQAYMTKQSNDLLNSLDTYKNHKVKIALRTE